MVLAQAPASGNRSKGRGSRHSTGNCDGKGYRVSRLSGQTLARGGGMDRQRAWGRARRRPGLPWNLKTKAMRDLPGSLTLAWSSWPSSWLFPGLLVTAVMGVAVCIVDGKGRGETRCCGSLRDIGNKSSKPKPHVQPDALK